MSLQESPDESVSGLTPTEAREFHRIFITSFIVFLVVALIAHYLAWEWRPWGGHYSTSMLDGASHVAGLIKSSFV
jgi:light-harvesting complex 1 beta chain